MYHNHLGVIDAKISVDKPCNGAYTFKCSESNDIPPDNTNTVTNTSHSNTLNKHNDSHYIWFRKSIAPSLHALYKEE